MADFDEEDWIEEVGQVDSDYQRIDQAPDDAHLLGPWTVVALMLNRTIGSGIFVSPIKVLNGTGSVATSLLFWTFGCIFSTAGLLVWLELGLSVPLRTVKVTPGNPGTFERKSVPRNGGEMNYLAFIFSNLPKFLVTCIYGIPFILLGNLAGNAIAIGYYSMRATGGDPNTTRGAVIGIAISALTASILLHVLSRRGGIIMSNIFAVIKVSFLIAIIIFGFLKASGHSLGGQPSNAVQNFDPENSFKTSRHDFASYSDSLQWVIYSFSGFLQPFYVLAEVARPRKVFPKYTLIGILITSVLFLLVNIAYLSAVPRNLPGIAQSTDMAELFFGEVFGDDKAKRVMDGVIAFSIFGGMVVMTFTAARVKQEIAKEGILPCSLHIASGYTTPWALFKEKFFSKTSSKVPALGRQSAIEGSDEHLEANQLPEALPMLEQTPMAALGLHWLASVSLVAVTAMLEPSKAYNVLVSLYIYVIRLLVGLFVSGGLLYLKLTPGRNWKSEANIKFWLDPFPAVIYCTTCGFLLITAFVKPGEGSPFSFEILGYEWWIVPTIGLSSLTWGVGWYLGLHLVMRRKMKELTVIRRVFPVPDRGVPGQYVQRGEIVSHEWHTKIW
ncbi:amino acid transporter [Stipitochalara longipes BDJ]|nr:amino acid transporter [Stipitochalara longipes BDJ]